MALQTTRSQKQFSRPGRLALVAALALCCTGCAVVTVADAAVSVAATTVKVGAKVVGATVDVGAAGVRAVTGGSSD
ncbi:MAG: hypothetical protein V4679_20670 [Pseudomonadota bacterium]